MVRDRRASGTGSDRRWNSGTGAQRQRPSTVVTKHASEQIAPEDGARRIQHWWRVRRTWASPAPRRLPRAGFDTDSVAFEDDSGAGDGDAPHIVLGDDEGDDAPQIDLGPQAEYDDEGLDDGSLQQSVAWIIDISDWKKALGAPGGGELQALSLRSPKGDACDGKKMEDVLSGPDVLKKWGMSPRKSKHKKQELQENRAPRFPA